MKFAIRKSSTAAARVDCVLDKISPDPAKPITLVLRYAGETNPGYMNAVFKSVKAAKPDDITAEWLEGRKGDVDLFVNHVVVGWKNAHLEDGTEAPFTADAVRAFLLALIDPPDGTGEVDRMDYFNAFDKMRWTARNLDNFRPPQADPVDLGKG